MSTFKREPFGGLQIAAVANRIKKQLKDDCSIEDNPIHPLGESVEDAITAASGSRHADPIIPKHGCSD